MIGTGGAGGSAAATGDPIENTTAGSISCTGGSFIGTGLYAWWRRPDNHSGALMVWIPWIPVYEKWVPWALFVLGPFLPDAYLWWYRRKHEKKLEALVEDLAREAETLDAYRPLSEIHEALGIGSEEPSAARDAESGAASRVRSH